MEQTYNSWWEFLENNPDELEKEIGIQDYIWKLMSGTVVRND